jgi:hypothetical protein
MKSLTCGKLLGVCMVFSTSIPIYGCGGKVSGPSVMALPSSPRDAYIQFIEALTEGNEAKLLDAVDANEPQREFLFGLMDFSTAASRFRRVFVKAYGEQAWKDFQDDSKAPKEGHAKLGISDAKEKVDKIRELTMEERGNEAFCDTVDEPGKKVRFLKVKDGWRMDVGSVTPEETEMRKLTGRMKELAGAVRKFEKAIGRLGIKPEDINAELGREFVKILTGIESPAPHRFDINKI